MIECSTHIPLATGEISIKDLTWQGHDFAALLNDGVWSRIKQKFSAEELAVMPLSIVKTLGLGLLEALAKQTMGLGN